MGDDHGPYALVAVRIGLVWTDSVAIVGEDQTLAMRHRTNDDRLILPTELPFRVAGGVAPPRPL